jgi:hypothetical protein
MCVHDGPGWCDIAGAESGCRGAVLLFEEESEKGILLTLRAACCGVSFLAGLLGREGEALACQAEEKKLSEHEI